MVTQSNVLHEETIYKVRDSYVNIGGYQISFSPAGYDGFFVAVSITKIRTGEQLFNENFTQEQCGSVAKLFDLLSAGLKPFNK